MNKPLCLLTAAVLSLGASAQTLRPSDRAIAPLNLGAAPAPTGVLRNADHIVALVNSEPITQADVRARLARLNPPSGAGAPSREELARQALEILISERVQLQWARESGLKVDDAALNEAEQNVARQNGLTLPQLHERLGSAGLTVAAFRSNLRNELLLQRVREREVDARVRVSEQDIDAYLRQQQSGNADPAQTVLNLAQVLIEVPENASAETVKSLLARAEDVARRARAGEDFAALARNLSQGPERNAGGQIGARTADRYPNLFVDAVRNLGEGGIAGPLRSGAGFHVLKVLEKRSLGLPDAFVNQTRARHILLTPGAQLSEAAAIERLRVLRNRVLAGQIRFDQAARESSQDTSAREGGDLGWAGPGQFVPEFERVMNALNPGEVSEPFVSRFGVHLVQVQERRRQPMSAREQREWVRNTLREDKLQEAYEDWVRDLRARAYIEFREAPQAQ